MKNRKKASSKPTKKQSTTKKIVVKKIKTPKKTAIKVKTTHAITTKKTSPKKMTKDSIAKTKSVAAKPSPPPSPKKEISLLSEVRQALALNREKVRKQFAAQQEMKQHQAFEQLKHLHEIHEARKDYLSSLNRGGKGYSGKMRHSGMRGK